MKTKFWCGLRAAVCISILGLAGSVASAALSLPIALSGNLIGVNHWDFPPVGQFEGSAIAGALNPVDVGGWNVRTGVGIYFFDIGSYRSQISAASSIDLVLNYLGSRSGYGYTPPSITLQFIGAFDQAALANGLGSQYWTAPTLAAFDTGISGSGSGRSVSIDVSSIAGDYTQQYLAFRLTPSSSLSETAQQFSYMASLEIAPVPEPTTCIAGALLLLPVGLQGIRMLRNRRQTS